MARHTLPRQWAFALGVLTLFACPCAAGVITDVHLIVGPGLGAANVGVTTVLPNNDDAGAANPNLISISKRFDRVAPIDIVFSVSNSVDATLRATTEYLISDTVLNNTGVSWRDFHFELGFGTGANFVRSGIDDGIDFDLPHATPPPSSRQFTRVQHEANTIDWSGGIVPMGATDLFVLSLDIFDGTLAIPAVARFPTCNGYWLTLRQVPTVPEPTVLTLAGFGAAGFALWTRRRRPKETRRRRGERIP